MNKLFTKNCGFLTSFINYPPLNIFFYQPLSSQTDIGINPICVKYQNLCLVYGTKKCCTSSNLESVQQCRHSETLAKISARHEILASAHKRVQY